MELRITVCYTFPKLLMGVVLRSLRAEIAESSPSPCQRAPGTRCACPVWGSEGQWQVSSPLQSCPAVEAQHFQEGLDHLILLLPEMSHPLDLRNQTSNNSISRHRPFPLLHLATHTGTSLNLIWKILNPNLSRLQLSPLLFRGNREHQGSFLSRVVHLPFLFNAQ